MDDERLDKLLDETTGRAAQLCWFCRLEDDDARTFVEAVLVRYQADAKSLVQRRVIEVLAKEFNVKVNSSGMSNYLHEEFQCH